jgi:cell division protein FtsW
MTTRIRQRQKQPGVGTAGAQTTAQRAAVVLQMTSAVYVCFALILMLSSSPVISTAEYGSSLALFERQIVWTILGGVAFLLAKRVDLGKVRRISPVLMVVVIFSLVLVYVAGKSSGGSSRWIGISFLHFQPTEFAKLIFAIFAADFVATREGTRHAVAQIIFPLGVVFAISAFLIVSQPDLGSTVMVTLIFFVILLGSGIDRYIFTRTVLLISGVGVLLSLSASYRRQRLLSFISPVAHEATSGYQLAQSLFALGSGHLTGTGFGASSATWGFLPNAQTDFIFAVIGNQYGYIGALLVMIGFVVIGVCGMKIAMRTADRFSSLLALALTTWIVGQAIINIGGVISVMPETGIPLPFLSYGGSSLIAILCAVGLLVNIANHSRTKTSTNTGLQHRFDDVAGLFFHAAPSTGR